MSRSRLGHKKSDSLVSVSSRSKNQHPLFLSLRLVVNFHKSNFSVSVSSQKIGLVPPVVCPDTELSFTCGRVNAGIFYSNMRHTCPILYFGIIIIVNIFVCPLSSFCPLFLCQLSFDCPLFVQLVHFLKIQELCTETCYFLSASGGFTEAFLYLKGCTLCPIGAG